MATEARATVDDQSPTIALTDPEDSSEFHQDLSSASPPSTAASSADGDAWAKAPEFAMNDDLDELFAENVFAKSWRTATRPLGPSTLLSPTQPPTWVPNAFPEICPQTGPNAGVYDRREPEFWTCGFFPGQLQLLHERLVRFPNSITASPDLPSNARAPCVSQLRFDIKTLCDIWSEPLHAMAGRTDTHDIGFIVMPALRLDWELTGNRRSLDSIVKAARSLATRYVPQAKAIRSWDLMIKKDIQITSMEDNVILIIDSMCNLDLLYYASRHSPADDSHLADMATAHATTLLRTHLRPEVVVLGPNDDDDDDAYTGPWYSTCHVANLCRQTGELKARISAQGYDHDSTWARGQAWGILGYATTYSWTKDTTFLRAACGLAEYFLHRLATAPSCFEVSEGEEEQRQRQQRRRQPRGRYVPAWDFDAPIDDPSRPLRDSSAGVIAANGLLVLSQCLAALCEDSLAARYRRAAVDLVQAALDFALADEKAAFVHGVADVADVVPGRTFEALMKYGTANNNRTARRRYADHGLTYGDYYLVEFGNRLLRMGLA